MEILTSFLLFWACIALAWLSYSQRPGHWLAFLMLIVAALAPLVQRGLSMPATISAREAEALFVVSLINLLAAPVALCGLAVAYAGRGIRVPIQAPADPDGPALEQLAEGEQRAGLVPGDLVGGFRGGVAARLGCRGEGAALALMLLLFPIFVGSWLARKLGPKIEPCRDCQREALRQSEQRQEERRKAGLPGTSLPTVPIPDSWSRARQERNRQQLRFLICSHRSYAGWDRLRLLGMACGLALLGQSLLVIATRG